MLAAIVRGDTLRRFAAEAPASWAALCRLSTLAQSSGCGDESRYGLIVDECALRTLLNTHEPTANKLSRLLPGAADPSAAYVPRQTRLKADQQWHYDGAERVNVVRVRFDGRVREHTLCWESIAEAAATMVRKRGRANLRDV